MKRPWVVRLLTLVLTLYVLSLIPLAIWGVFTSFPSWLFWGGGALLLASKWEKEMGEHEDEDSDTERWWDQ